MKYVLIEDSGAGEKIWSFLLKYFVSERSILLSASSNTKLEYILTELISGRNVTTTTNGRDFHCVGHNETVTVYPADSLFVIVDSLAIRKYVRIWEIVNTVDSMRLSSYDYWSFESSIALFEHILNWLDRQEYKDLFDRLKGFYPEERVGCSNLLEAFGAPDDTLEGLFSKYLAVLSYNRADLHIAKGSCGKCWLCACCPKPASKFKQLHQYCSAQVAYLKPGISLMDKLRYVAELSPFASVLPDLRNFYAEANVVLNTLFEAGEVSDDTHFFS